MRKFVHILCVLCIVATGFQFAGANGDTDTACFNEIAHDELELAKWCAGKGMNPEAQQWLEQALAHAPADNEAAKLRDKLAGGANSEAPSDKTLEEYGKKVEKTRAKLCKTALQAVQLHAAAKDTVQAGKWLTRALEWKPGAKEAAALLEQLWKKARDQKHWPEACEWIELQARHFSDNASVKATLKQIRSQAAVNSIARLRCLRHPMIYRVSLPAKWNDKQKWPLIVAVEGAGCDWELYMNGFIEAGVQSKGYVLITMETTSNTNALAREKYSYTEDEFAEMQKPDFTRLDFDRTGLSAVLDEAEECFNVDRGKVFITGFSGGGILTYYMIFQQWDQIAAAAPSSPNFTGTYGVPKQPDDEKTLPILISIGEQDKHIAMIDPQSKKAAEELEKYKYTNVTVKRDPAAWHISFAKDVVAFFDTVLAKQK